MIYSAFQKNSRSALLFAIGFGCFILSFLTLFFYYIASSRVSLTDFPIVTSTAGIACALLFFNINEENPLINTSCFGLLAFFAFFGTISCTINVSVVSSAPAILNLIGSIILLVNCILVVAFNYSGNKIIMNVTAVLALLIALLSLISYIFVLATAFSIAFLFIMFFDLGLTLCLFLGNYFLYKN